MSLLASWVVVLAAFLTAAALVAIPARRQGSQVARITSVIIAWVPLTVLGFYGMLGVIGTVAEGTSRDTLLILFGMPVVLLPHAYRWLGGERSGLGATLLGLALFGGRSSPATCSSYQSPSWPTQSGDSVKPACHLAAGGNRASP